MEVSILEHTMLTIMVKKIRLIGEVKKWNKPVPEAVIDRLSTELVERKMYYVQEKSLEELL